MENLVSIGGQGMRIALRLLLYAAVIFSACGCYRTELWQYEPRGSSWGKKLPSFGMELPGYFVRASDESLLPQYIFANYSYDILRIRSATSGFRMLCAIVNTYFGQWDRLVIIERLEHGGCYETGFIAVAVVPTGLMAVTNYGPEGPNAGMWVATDIPRSFKVDRERFNTLMVRLDMARKPLPRGMFWFPNIDWPVYILHDISADGQYLSYAIAGWAEIPEDGLRERLLMEQPTYAQAAKFVDGATPWMGIPEGSNAARELRQAGAVYATLIDLVWKCTLGMTDYLVLEVDPWGPPPAESASSLEHERVHSGTLTRTGPGSP